MSYVLPNQSDARKKYMMDLTANVGKYQINIMLSLSLRTDGNDVSIISDFCVIIYSFVDNDFFLFDLLALTTN